MRYAKRTLNRLRRRPVPFLYTGIFLLVMLIVGVHLFSDINYNSPFNDEAIYAVVGRLGLFQHDWQSYNAGAWVSGWQLLYPALTALAYQTAGVIGSRVLNVIVALMFIEILVILGIHITGADGLHALFVSVLTALFIGFSGSFYFVSRLATMDLMSFFFLFAAFLSLTTAATGRGETGKTFFIAALLTGLSVLLKYASAVAVPFLILSGYALTRGQARKTKRMWFAYYLVPLFASMIVFGVMHAGQLFTYFAVEVENIHSPVQEVLGEFWLNYRFMLPLWIIGSAGMLAKRRVRWWILLTVLALAFPAYHLVTLREQTLMKHLLVTAGATALIAGIGFADLLTIRLPVSLRAAMFGMTGLTIGLYITVSMGDNLRLNTWWADTAPVMSWFAAHTKPKDLILAESGSAIILANYDRTKPEHVTTFDWFSYRQQEGTDAYLAAVRDGYFSYIELEKHTEEEDGQNIQMNRQITEAAATNYERVFNRDGYLIYKRVY